MLSSRAFNGVNDVGNLALGLCETLGSVSTAAVATGLLPNFGIAAGLMDIVYVCAWGTDCLADQYTISEEDDEEQEELIIPQHHNSLLMFTKFGAGIFSIIEGMENLVPFPLGTHGLLPIALAIRSGVDLCCAIETFCHENSVEEEKGNPTAAGVDIIKKAVAFTGWCLVATGNPLGWVFLVASAALSFVARAECLGGHGFSLFSSRKKADTDVFNNTGTYELSPSSPNNRF